MHRVTLRTLRSHAYPFTPLLKTISTATTADYFKNTFNEILQEKEKYGFHKGKFKTACQKTVIVEYSSPNIAKRFHAGHFRSTIVGHALSNIIEAAGNNVIRINYLGDWGLQFAVVLAGFERYGSQEKLFDQPLKHLLEVYVEASKHMKEDASLKQHIQEIFLDMESGNEESIRFWKLCRSASLEEFEKLYKRIGVTFDCYDSESIHCRHARAIVDEMRAKDVLTVLENGAEGIDVSESDWVRERTSSLPPEMHNATLTRSNGTSLYLTRDIAAAIKRKEVYNFDEMYYVTDYSQEYHFLHLFAILELMGKQWAKPEANSLHHIAFGRVQGMKTRTGDVVFIEDIIREASDLVREQRLNHHTRKKDVNDVESVIRTLSLSGLICNDLKSKLRKDYVFRWNVALQTKGFTGLFLQYSHSRLHSLKENCGVQLSYDTDCSSLTGDKSAEALVLSLNSFSDVAWRAYEELEPCYITQYAFDLSRLIGRGLEQLPVKGQPPSVAQPRLLLFHCAQIVLSNCLLTLGMKPLNKM